MFPSETSQPWLMFIYNNERDIRLTFLDHETLVKYEGLVYLIVAHVGTLLLMGQWYWMSNKTKT